MRRVFRWSALVSLAILPDCSLPAIAPGTITCTTDNPCPDNWVCVFGDAGLGLCFANAPTSSGTSGAATSASGQSASSAGSGSTSSHSSTSTSAVSSGATATSGATSGSRTSASSGVASSSGASASTGSTSGSSGTAATYALSVSASPNHTAATTLESAVLTGNAYVFTSDAANLANFDPSGITQVCFWLDNTAMSGTATHCESAMPYDFAGSTNNTAASTGLPWNTAAVANGTHTLTQSVTLPAGGTEVDTATFSISNGVSTSGTTSSAGGTSTSSSTSGASSTSSGSGTTSGSTSGSFVHFFSPTSFWNTPIPANPTIDPNSTAMVQASLVTHSGNQYNFANGAFGPALAYASATDKVYSVTCTNYATPSCTPGGTVQFPIPAGTQAATGTDHHLAVAYPALDGSPYAGKSLECWEANYNSANDAWSGDCAIIDISVATGYGAACPSGQHCVGPCAAGFSVIGGAVRPEEIAQGHIDHAIALATSYNWHYLACPATNSDGNVGAATDSPPPAVPEGAHLQLDPAYPVDAQSWPQWVKIIAHALQTYGAYDRDFAGFVNLYGVPDQNAGVPSWASVGVPVDQYHDLDQLPWGSMRVLQLSSCN